MNFAVDLDMDEDPTGLLVEVWFDDVATHGIDLCKL